MQTSFSRRVSAGVLVACLATHASFASAQVASTASVDSLVLRAAGHVAGRDAAERRRMSGHAVAGFFGGVALGFGGLIYHPAALGGVGIILSAGTVGRTALDSVAMPLAQAHGPIFADAFRGEYERTLRARRRKLALAGSVIGVAAGYVTLLCLIFSDPNY